MVKIQIIQLKIGKAPEQTFYQRTDTNGQQIQGKMFNITKHQGYTNQNHNDILPDTCQDGYYQKQKRNPKNQEIILAGWREKSETWYIVGGKVYLYSHYEKQQSIPQKITNRNTI